MLITSVYENSASLFVCEEVCVITISILEGVRLPFVVELISYLKLLGKSYFCLTLKYLNSLYQRLLLHIQTIAGKQTACKIHAELVILFKYKRKNISESADTSCIKDLCREKSMIEKYVLTFLTLYATVSFLYDLVGLLELTSYSVPLFFEYKTLCM